jgi:hypothetical protein
MAKRFADHIGVRLSNGQLSIILSQLNEVGQIRLKLVPRERKLLDCAYTLNSLGLSALGVGWSGMAGWRI